MKKRNLFPMNEMDLKFSKIIIFPNQNFLEIRKCFSMVLMLNFDIFLKLFSLKCTKTDSRIYVEAEKMPLDSLQNILNCQAELLILLKLISVLKSSMSVSSNIAALCLISKFCSQN